MQSWLLYQVIAALCKVQKCFSNYNTMHCICNKNQCFFRNLILIIDKIGGSDAGNDSWLWWRIWSVNIFSEKKILEDVKSEPRALTAWPSLKEFSWSNVLWKLRLSKNWSKPHHSESISTSGLTQRRWVASACASSVGTISLNNAPSVKLSTIQVVLQIIKL